MQLSPDFRELRGVGASDLLYVKEDIILQHSHSFYDLIVNKVRLSLLVLHPFSPVTFPPDWRSRQGGYHPAAPAQLPTSNILVNSVPGLHGNAPLYVL